jgi:hypothetical protein
MFAHDLCHSQIEYFRNDIDFNRKDRAKRYHKSSIFNLKYSIPACPGWALRVICDLLLEYDEASIL